MKMGMSFISGSTFSRRSFLLIFLIPGLSFCRLVAQEPVLSDSLRLYQSAMERGEFYLSVDRPRGRWYDSLTPYASIDQITSDRVILYVNPSGYQKLKELRFDPRLLTPPSLKGPIPMSKGEFPGNWDLYPTHQEYLDHMFGLASGFPKLCKLDTIGYSKQNRPLLSLEITGDTAKEFRPSFFYTATMHGDEVAGYIILLRLADHLLKAYGQDTAITELLDQVSVCINPLSNPDGTYALTDTSISGATRFNSEGTDLNRNFPDPSGNQYPDGRNRAPENLAMMKYMEEKEFEISCNLHGGAEVLNYPWDTWSRLHADNQWFVTICRAYADTVHRLDPDYLNDLNNGITNGYAWYEVDGSRQDYVTYYLRGREITLEILEEKIPDGNFLPRLWTLNRSSLIQLMEKTKYGLRGRVLDSLSGRPLKAEIRHVSDRDRSSVFSDSLTGIYHRYLSGGSYAFTVSAAGYREKAKTVDIIESGAQRLDFFLKPEDEPEKSFAVRLENPFSGTMELSVDMPRDARVRIRIYDLQGRLCIEQGTNALTEGNNEINIPTGGLADGVYILSIEIPGTPGIRYREKIIKVNIH